MEVIKLPISSLRRPKQDARVHPEKQLHEYERSVSMFGQIRPLVVDENNTILAGVGCYETLQRMGIDAADVYRIENLTEEQKKKLRLTDNRLSELGYDDLDLLREIFSEIHSDIPGYDEAIIADLIDQANETTAKMINESCGYEGSYVAFQAVPDAPAAREDNFEPKPPETAITQIGDIYCLGKHRLMCGDSTSVTDVETLMDGSRARCVFTDPPWNVDYGGDESHPSWKPRRILNDHMSTEKFGAFLMSSFSAMKEASEPGCMTYIVMSAQEWGNLMDVLNDLEYHWSSTIIWKKDSLVLSRKDYHTQYEPIWYGWLNGSRLCPLEDRKQSDVWDIPRPKVSEEHPTMKPVELVERALRNSSHANDAVLDLFGGSGTTMIAAEETGRRCFMMELDPKYCDVIVRRYIKLVGADSDVRLLRNGEEIPFREVAADE